MRAKQDQHRLARLRSLRAAMLASAALCLALPLAADPAPPCDPAPLPLSAGCARPDAGRVVAMPAGENTERARSGPGAGFAEAGFAISVDGAPVAGALPPLLPELRSDPHAAEEKIDIRFDGLARDRLLNVATGDLGRAYPAGARVHFRSLVSYPAFIDRAEVRILDRSGPEPRLLAALPLAANGTVDWTMPAEGGGTFAYVLRVYDDRGRYDETHPLDLIRSDGPAPRHATTGTVVAAGAGEDRTRLRMIPIRGGTVTVAGRDLPPGATVRVMGETVPLGPEGGFVFQRVLPPGDHEVAVEAGGRRITRTVTIPRSDVFAVGIADLTFGRRLEDDLAGADPDYDRSFLDGRLAGYATGRTSGGLAFTLSVDSGEGPVGEIFQRMAEKDPRRVVARLDPDDLYPTYGDDSVAVDDAPTSGRVYLRLERDGQRFLWGDFSAELPGTELLETRRSLYGASVRLATPRRTDSGAPRLSFTGFAAQPDTLPRRDVLRGTGGSVYFLSRQDISGGSETVSIVLSDPVSGAVVERRPLAAGADYRIDYFQGVILLAEPLSATARGTRLIGEGQGDYDSSLVADYEYTPTTGDLDGMSTGGRVAIQATERLRIGLTGTREATGAADQRATGTDLRFGFGETGHVEAEIAQTEGPGFGHGLSTDGGLTLVDQAPVGGRALGWRVETAGTLADLGFAAEGRFRFHGEHRAAGFATLVDEATENRSLAGAAFEIAANPRLRFGLEAERAANGARRESTAEIRATRRIGDDWEATFALAGLDRVNPGDPAETGRRSDVALRLDYLPTEDRHLYAFGQGTLDRSGGLGRNDRAGAGFDLRLSEKLTASGEVSAGSLGPGGLLRLAYAATPDDEIYAGYLQDPAQARDVDDPGQADDGGLVLGTRTRLSPNVTSYTESTWDLVGPRRSLSRAYGVSYTPDPAWSVSGAVEAGEVRDTAGGDFDRQAYSFSVAHTREDRSGAHLRLEYRTEDGAGVAQDRKSWALSSGFTHRLNADWRLVGDIDALWSRSDESSLRDGEYVEASLGYAWRPVANDRVNLLMRYTHLRDLPGEDQVTADGRTDAPLQVSHVVSVDGNVDVTPRLTLGGKYGLRLSRVADRGTEAFTDATAQLGILRLDWHLTHSWDVLGEVRAMRTQETGITEHGALVAVYRHVGNNGKIGLGYEWGSVSDRPTDLDYRARGLLINVVAKF